MDQFTDLDVPHTREAWAEEIDDNNLIRVEE